MQSVNGYTPRMGGGKMEWKALRKAIIQECRIQNKEPDYIEKYLVYCKKLYSNNLPIISSPAHFSMLVGIQHEYVCSMAYSPQHFYRQFEIPKSNGKMRTIDEPLPDLKYIQRWILTNILEKKTINPYAKAFYRGRGVKENARFHRSQVVLVTMDIKDFFPSIKINSIVSIFRELGYYDDVSNFLAHLCCLNYALPQGAPTSPYLSNLRLSKFDQNVSDFTTANKIRYTRYADDMTFSGNFDPHQLIPRISKMLYSEGFSVNPAKTRVAFQNARQEVTGVVVNSHMQISKTQRKKIRQEIYYIKKYGLDSHLTKTHETREHYLEHLLGKLNFACYINPHDEELKTYYSFIKSLLSMRANDN